MPKTLAGEPFRVSQILVTEKVGGGYQDFPSKNFFRRLPRNFVGEAFSVSLFSGSEKVWIREGVESIKIFHQIFCLTVPKISVGESFTVALISVIEKVWTRAGEYQDFFVECFLSHIAETFRSGTLQCFTNLG